MWRFHCFDYTWCWLPISALFCTFFHCKVIGAKLRGKLCQLFAESCHIFTCTFILFINILSVLVCLLHYFIPIFLFSGRYGSQTEKKKNQDTTHHFLDFLTDVYAIENNKEFKKMLFTWNLYKIHHFWYNNKHKVKRMKELQAECESKQWVQFTTNQTVFINKSWTDAWM